MKQIRDGRYDLDIDPKLSSSKDEIGQLAHGFERLTDYIKTNKENFEELVHAQTEQLEKNNIELQ